VTTFVTGASGFLGRHLVEALVARGDDVRAFVRDSTDAGPLAAQGVEVVRGELADHAALARAADGCPLVFHLAGIVSHEPSRLAELQAVNVDGIRNLLGAVEAAARGVQVSIVAPVGPAC
jgi:nucleoside-diphosphate-sugar epimerase